MNENLANTENDIDSHFVLFSESVKIKESKMKTININNNLIIRSFIYS